MMMECETQNVPLLNGMRVEDEMDDKELGIKLILTEAAGEVVSRFCRIYLGGARSGHRFEKGQCNAQTEFRDGRSFFL